MNTVRLWWTLRRRDADAKDPQSMTSILAIVAFGATTAILLVVIGGFMAFVDRAGIRMDSAPHPPPAPGATEYDGMYVFLAGFAVLLLLIPLMTLGGSAARLAVARRDARLAALRLAGATTSQVTMLALLDAMFQAIMGAMAGVLGYLALIPLVARLRFQGRTFALAELWTGPVVLLVAVIVVLAVAALSSLVSLRRVALTPLGVAARTTPPALRAVRFVIFAVIIAAVWVLGGIPLGLGELGIFILVGFIVAGFATLNLVGPFLIWIIGHLTARWARGVPSLLAGRRMVDSPRTAWRSVGGIALATFIAGMTSLVALFDAQTVTSAADIQFLADMKTGGFLTLAIAGILAAVSTGVTQAGRVIDQRAEYRSLVLAGTDVKTLDRARFRETMIPLTASVGLAAGTALLLLIPMLGATAFAQVGVVVQFTVCVAGGYALVLLGAGTSRLVARSILATSGTV